MSCFLLWNDAAHELSHINELIYITGMATQLGGWSYARTVLSNMSKAKGGGGNADGDGKNAHPFTRHDTSRHAMSRRTNNFFLKTTSLVIAETCFKKFKHDAYNNNQVSPKILWRKNASKKCFTTRVVRYNSGVLLSAYNSRTYRIAFVVCDVSIHCLYWHPVVFHNSSSIGEFMPFSRFKAQSALDLLSR